MAQKLISSYQTKKDNNYMYKFMARPIFIMPQLSTIIKLYWSHFIWKN